MAKSQKCDTETNPPLAVELFPHKPVQKELQGLPKAEQERFGISLSLLANHQDPTCKLEQYQSIGKDIYELKINGSPAYRCIYTTMVPGKIIVLHACVKTTNGPDRQIKAVVEERRKALREELKAEAKATKKGKKNR